MNTKKRDVDLFLTCECGLIKKIRFFLEIRNGFPEIVGLKNLRMTLDENIQINELQTDELKKMKGPNSPLNVEDLHNELERKKVLIKKLKQKKLLLSEPSNKEFVN